MATVLRPSGLGKRLGHQVAHQPKWQSKGHAVAGLAGCPAHTAVQHGLNCSITDARARKHASILSSEYKFCRYLHSSLRW